MVLAIVMVGCGRKMELLYSADVNNGATLIIQPSNVVEGAFLEINGKVVVDNQKVDKITIYQIPRGIVNIKFYTTTSIYRNNLLLEEEINFQGKQKVVRTIDVSSINTWTPIIVSNH